MINHSSNVDNLPSVRFLFDAITKHHVYSSTRIQAVFYSYMLLNLIFVYKNNSMTHFYNSLASVIDKLVRPIPKSGLGAC